MTTALATLHRFKTTLLIDAGLLLALYMLPGLSHLTAYPLYKLEPMRIALIIALLFTNRANTYLIAFTIPLASSVVTGHPELFKAVLMGIEFSILVATFSYLVRSVRLPAIAALTAGILFSKLIYYSMKFIALNAGFLTGKLISTPVQTQVVLAVGTAVVFGLVEYFRAKSGRQSRGQSNLL